MRVCRELTSLFFLLISYTIRVENSKCTTTRTSNDRLNLYLQCSENAHLGPASLWGLHASKNPLAVSPQVESVMAFSNCSPDDVETAFFAHAAVFAMLAQRKYDEYSKLGAGPNRTNRFAERTNAFAIAREKGDRLLDEALALLKSVR